MKSYTTEIRPIENDKGWNSTLVEIFKDGNKIGEYVRNYPSFYNTFEPFKVNGQELALYSPDYTCTRIMRLPDCVDIGGEEPDSFGFCPTGFYVPAYFKREHKYVFNNEDRTQIRTLDYKYQRKNEKEPEDDELVYHPFGFVSGCVWGDDSSWKVQYLDLSEADKGILTNSAKFGYLELPDSMSLKEAVTVYHENPSYVRIVSQRTFDRRTGRDEMED